MCLLIADPSPVEGQIICPLGSGLHLAGASAGTAANTKPHGHARIERQFQADLHGPGRQGAKLHWSPASSLRGILAKEGLMGKKGRKDPLFELSLTENSQVSLNEAADSPGKEKTWLIFRNVVL